MGKAYVIRDGSKYLLPSGYIDVFKILNDDDSKYIFVVGGRGCGKTYGAIDHVVVNKQNFFFMRRTQTQLDAITVPCLSPFDQYNTDHGTEISLKKVHKQISLVMNGDDTIGFAGALSTLSNVRGVNAEWLDLLLYDEFIPEPHQLSIKEEASAFKNVYETLNRNRELNGKPPIKALCLSNSDSVACPIFLDWGLLTGILECKGKGYNIGAVTWPKRGIKVILINDTPILQQKKETSLYVADEGTKFSSMALENDFIYDDFTCVESKDLKQYRILAKIGYLCLYKHKSKAEYYCTRHCSGSPAVYQDTELGRRSFRLRYATIQTHLICQRVYFEEYDLKVFLTEHVFNVKMR